jgi:L-arabinokinase
MLVAFVSGHGFGHATRTAEVLRAVRRRAPELPITVCGEAPAFLFERVVAQPLSVRPVACDVGLVQSDALTIDEQATAAALDEFLDGFDVLVSREARFLREAGARAVLGDIPPLAFAAAAAAGVPGIALGNFSWDWIYGHYGVRQPALARAARHAAAAYASAELLLRLPFAGDLSVFRSVVDVPLLARRPALSRPEARGRLRLDERPTVLLSFGGIGMPELSPASFAALGEYAFVLTGRAGAGEARNVRRLEAAELAESGLDYPDLVGACDVVVSKPGYGIVTDCIGARTRLVYTDRGDFPEYDVLVGEMERFLPAVFVASAELREGRLGGALGRVLEMPFPAQPALNGAEVAAERLIAALG